MWYNEANADLPKIGTKLMVTDFSGNAQSIIETKKVAIIPFNQISKDYAELGMETEIETLDNWKKHIGNFLRMQWRKADKNQQNEC